MALPLGELVKNTHQSSVHVAFEFRDELYPIHK